MEQGCVRKGHKKGREKTVRIFIDFTLATAGIAVGAILGLFVVSLICIVLKAI